MLKERGLEPSDAALEGALKRLKNDGYIEAYFRAGGAATLIRLDSGGLKEVEGWPAVPGSVSVEDAEKLVAVLRARAEDPALAEAERSEARAAAEAVKDLGIQVAAIVMSGWLKSIGVGRRTWR